MDVVLLGSGNVATHLGGALLNAGHRVAQVYSPTKAHAETLAHTLNAEAIGDLTTIEAYADVYIIAVKDDAIAAVIAQLPSLLRGVVIHTAGSVDMGIFAMHVANYGVLYPLQTFSKAKTVDFSTVPIAVEASDEATFTLLAKFADSLSNRVFRCDSKQRLSLHVAAVFACNFTNHFYAIAAGLLVEHGLEFDLIRPLIFETAEKVMEHHPRDAQTGPAIRNDERTMHRHLELLENHPGLKEIYEKLSRWIGGNGVSGKV